MPFIESKSKKSSLTLWGAGAAILAPIAALAGYNLTETDTSDLVNAISLAVAVAGVGGLAAWVGRIRANKTVR